MDVKQEELKVGRGGYFEVNQLLQRHDQYLLQPIIKLLRFSIICGKRHEGHDNF